MNIKMSRECLVAIIRRSAEHGFEARQVSRRLGDLLPTRFHNLKQKMSRQSWRGAAGERRALTSGEYIDYLEEISQTRFEAIKAKVEYETHLMLYQARQTLAKMKR